MDFAFTSEQELLRSAVRELAEQAIAPRVDSMEETDQVPVDLLRQMAAQGFLGVTVPQELGGTGLGHLARMIMLEEVARVSPALSMSLQCLHFGVAAVAESGNQLLIDQYLQPLLQGEIFAAAGITEASGGSDPTAGTTTAREKEGGFVLNGRKVFITNSHISDTAMIVAKTADEPKKEFTAFWVDKKYGGFRPGRAEKKIGFHGCVTGELILEECFVPAENILGTRGQGLAYALKGISDYGRTGIVGVALGIMQACLEKAIKFAGERVLYGKPISNLPSIHFKIAEMHADLNASRLLAYQACWQLDQKQRADLAIATAKFFCTEAALRVSRKAMDIMGGYGCMVEYGVERYLRDAQLLVPADGTNDIMRVVAGKTLTAAPRKK
ncbi:MAG: acyl-CoA dehydrogenase family protein [Desulfurispora sp.]|uniref:acyl-CoA dehydrogenase family protein n=1 Tax=Desulfurispora sp. TaxID=3014275 RepID=UPI00404AC10F